MSFRSGFVAIIGLPNSGKSTLMNCLVGEKVAIVSPKPQTTRRRVVGISNTEAAQIIFVDAPGVLARSSNELNKFLVHEYQSVLSEADGALAIVAGDEALNSRSDGILALIEESKKPFAVIVTKIDLLRPDQLNAVATKFAGRNVIFGSALYNPAGFKKDILDMASLLLPEGEVLYDRELFTTETVRDLAAETIREKCFLNLHQEIPFGLAVKITSFKEDAKLNRIEADILVEREAHKKIVIGHGGSALKKIGTDARLELEKVLDGKVFLGLHVVCKPHWMQDKSLMRELGYADRN